MSIEIDAIYEDGVLKPLGPVSLPDRQRVHVTIEHEDRDLGASTLSKQAEAVTALLAEFGRLKNETPADGFSSSRHDDVLYGQPE